MFDLYFQNLGIDVMREVIWKIDRIEDNEWIKS